MRITLDHLRRYAVGRSLFKPTTLGRAIAKLGFVQADPIRAPARAQDLTLRHRVTGYRAGDLERRYPALPIEEDFFVNYGFLSRAHRDLMHPRTPRTAWTPGRCKKALAILEFVRERGAVHPRAVDAHFAHGKVTNWFGGRSNASTQLLDEMHYRGWLRIARREGGTRIYAVREAVHAGATTADPAVADPATADRRFDALLDVVMNKYAPLPGASLGQLASLLCGGAPQWRSRRAAALARAKARFARVRLDGMDWYWPAAESPTASRWRPDAAVRLLTPFDPVVWDRRRFSLFWNWTYRFEAYTPAARRKLGYYALPILHGERVLGWANVGVSAGRLQADFGYVDDHRLREASFATALEEELERLREFLGLARESGAARFREGPARPAATGPADPACDRR